VVGTQNEENWKFIKGLKPFQPISLSFWVTLLALFDRPRLPSGFIGVGIIMSYPEFPSELVTNRMLLAAPFAKPLNVHLLGNSTNSVSCNSIAKHLDKLLKLTLGN
jgi:hypothetical protein